MSFFRVSLKATVALSFFLTGCAVGPDFVKPSAPNAQSYVDGTLPEQTQSADIEGGQAQIFVHGKDIPAAWWTMFHSEPLNKLIEKAIEANPSLRAAEASLRAAQESASAGEGAFFPQIAAGFGAERDKTSGATTGALKSKGSIYNLFNTSVSVSYTLDLFGQTRRTVEALEAQTEYQRYMMEAAYLSLTSNVVITVIQEATLREQIAATKKIIEDERKQLDLIKQQFDIGAIAKSGVLAQSAKLAQTEATLPSLEKSLAQTRHQLSVLIGQFPSEELTAAFDLNQLRLPTDLPVSLPSKLVEQRPDVQAAQSLMHAASAKIGIATANMLPQITLSGGMGTAADVVANFFTPGSAVWSLAGGVAQPIFRGGELLHKKRAAEAVFDAAAAEYRGAVLTAFQNVADALRALDLDAVALKTQLAAEQVAKESLDLTKAQYEAGAVSYTTLLSAEQVYEQAKIALVSVRALRFVDTVALFQALGGGWWNKENQITQTK